MKVSLKACTILLLTVTVSGCSALMPGDVSDNKVQVKNSPIEGGKSVKAIQDDAPDEGKQNRNSAEGMLTNARRMERLEVMSMQRVGETEVGSLEDSFSDTEEVSVSSNSLPLNDFIHYVFGDLLNVNYVLDEETQNSNRTVTMSLADDVSERKLFQVARSAIEERGFQLSQKEGIYYITSLEESASKNLIIGIGNTVESVPNTDREILQIVSLDYGYRSQMGLVAQTMAKVEIREDSQQGVLFIEGRQEEIIKALDFFNLVDNPSPMARNIAAIDLVFLSPDELVKQLSEVMNNEGIMVTSRANSSASVVLTPIETSGQVIVFARNQDFLARVDYWVNRLDVPSGTNEKQYFIYQPEFARAADLGDSISPLLGGDSNRSGSDNNSQSEESSAGNSANERRNRSNSQRTAVTGEDLSMIVDERTNSLVFLTSGEKYHALLPLIKRLDTQPKQVMLEVIIAEVTLTDSFEKGVEFTLEDGNGVATTEGGFGLDGIGGFSYALSGLDGDIRFKLFRDSSLVNILSRPSVVVRDGIAASISVGTDIPVVGQTTSDPIAGERQTTKIEYRKTGIELTVTPTVNSKGVVIMTIDQSISNTVDGGVSVQGSPSIFERTISTEVVADSGQTIVLGGLISENTTNSEASIPGLGKLPLIGHLFRSDSDTTDKTELVVMVTPRIIERSDQWEKLKQQFKTQFERLAIDEEPLEN